jgi:hypothetical protein
MPKEAYMHKSAPDIIKAIDVSSVRDAYLERKADGVLFKILGFGLVAHQKKPEKFVYGFKARALPTECLIHIPFSHVKRGEYVLCTTDI